MPNDKSKPGGQDRTRVDLSEDELHDWAKKFGVSEDELKAAVRQVGDRADAVQKHLKSKTASN